MFKIVPKEIKEEILKKVKLGEKATELAKIYGISDKTIYNWLKVQIKPDVSLIDYNKLKRENEELKKLLGMMVLDLDQEKKEKYLRNSDNKKFNSKILSISRKASFRTSRIS